MGCWCVNLHTHAIALSRYASNQQFLSYGFDAQCAFRVVPRAISDACEGVLEKCVTQVCEHPSLSLGCNALNAPGIVLSATGEIVKSWFVSENSVRDQIGRIGMSPQW
jgi:hypothetical protein